MKHVGTAAVERIPVLRPQLARFERIEPYLRRIDDARTYTNRGALISEFEARLVERLGVANVVTAASGTLALVAAILATAGRATEERPLAFVPSFTFVATALAAELCGYRPYVVDVDAATWMLSAERLHEHARLDRCGIVITVAPFGRPFAQEPWLDFRDRTNVDVVIDAAASFDVLDAGGTTGARGALPVALSFHATKALGVGEGGAVLSDDSEIALRSFQSLNLGFAGSRDCRIASLNGKLSEYHAAVGLAELDAWPEKSAAFSRVARAYRDAAKRHGLENSLVTSPDISGCYVLVDASDCEGARRIAAALTANGIGSRFWYGGGIHRHEYFADVERDAIPIGDDIAGRLLGIPVAPDLGDGDIETIVAVVAGALKNADAYRV